MVSFWEDIAKRFPKRFAVTWVIFHRFAKRFTGKCMNEMAFSQKVAGHFSWTKTVVRFRKLFQLSRAAIPLQPSHPPLSAATRYGSAS